MKFTITILIAVLFATTAYTQQVNIARWTFPTGNMTDTLPDAANSLNTSMSIRTTGGVSAIAFKNGATTKAAQATAWDNGQGTKAWQIEINATGYGKIQVSSKQTAGGNSPGPRDFKLQYRIGVGSAWTDVAGGTVTAANEWTTGVLTNLQLPDECTNIASVFIRWVTTSNLDANGAALVSSGIAKIDDIIVTGEVISGIENPAATSLSINVYPNPASDRLTIQSSAEIKHIEVYSMTGSKVYDLTQSGLSLTIDVSRFQPGRYLLLVYLNGSSNTVVPRGFLIE